MWSSRRRSEAELEAAGHRNFALTIEDAIKHDPRGVWLTERTALAVARNQWELADLLERIDNEKRRIGRIFPVKSDAASAALTDNGGHL